MAAALLSLMGVVAGAFIALQAPINAQLSRGLGLPLAAAAASFLSGTIVLLFLTWVFSQTQGVSPSWRGPAPWLFVAGGCLGAVYVTSTIILTPRIGAAAVMAFAVTGQLLAGILIDRAGFLGVPVHEISMGRMTGAALLLAGALLIRLT
ncbi:MAG: DMT family transporter [Rhizobiaceae bacterium]